MAFTIGVLVIYAPIETWADGWHRMAAIMARLLGGRRQVRTCHECS